MHAPKQAHRTRGSTTTGQAFTFVDAMTSTTTRDGLGARFHRRA
ncbi:MAG TPA: hypothetical protein PL051_01635 [Candidatus Saccharibacteria bacterium]|nr:hypothetical protein [Candidatus Saccharibacteria bacterium]